MRTRPTAVLILVALLAITLTAGSALAQGSVKKAKELVLLVTPKEAYEKSIEQMTTQMLGAMRAQGQQIPAGIEQKLKAAVMEAMPYDEMLTWTTEIYAKRFSDKELGDLIAFYKTPTGRKAAKMLPELMGEVGAKTATVLPQRLPAALKKHGVM